MTLLEVLSKIEPLKSSISTGKLICEQCGSAYYGSSQNEDGSLTRHCHGGAYGVRCDNKWHESEDDKHLYVSWDEIKKTTLNTEHKRANQDESDNRFFRDIQHAINHLSRESVSNTPDFILAKFLCDALSAFETAVNEREKLKSIGKETACCVLPITK